MPPGFIKPSTIHWNGVAGLDAQDPDVPHDTGRNAAAPVLDDGFAERSMENIGAWIMGRNMFGPIRGPWLDDSLCLVEAVGKKVIVKINDVGPR